MGSRAPPAATNTWGETRGVGSVSLSLSLGRAPPLFLFFHPQVVFIHLSHLFFLFCRKISPRAPRRSALSSIRKILKPKNQIDDSSTRKNYYFVQRRRHFYLDFFGKRKIKEEAKEKWLTTRQRTGSSSQQQTKSDSIEKESQCVRLCGLTPPSPLLMCKVVF